MIAQAKQPNNHGEKQDEVSGESDDDVQCLAINVEREAGSLNRVPHRADLRIDKRGRSKAIGTAYSPV